MTASMLTLRRLQALGKESYSQGMEGWRRLLLTMMGKEDRMKDDLRGRDQAVERYKVLLDHHDWLCLTPCVRSVTTT